LAVPEDGQPGGMVPGSIHGRFFARQASACATLDDLHDAHRLAARDEAPSQPKPKAYQEGRKVKNSRQARAMEKGSRISASPACC